MTNPTTQPTEGNAEFQRVYRFAMHGKARAQNWVGACYYQGNHDVKQNYKTAVHWYTKAAEQNNASAQFNLAVCYDKGRGVLPNDETAAHWYSKAAAQNDADAQYNLGVCYKRGLGVYSKPIQFFPVDAEQRKDEVRRPG